MGAIYELMDKIEYFTSFLDILLCTYFCSAFMEELAGDKNHNVIKSIFICGLAILTNAIFLNFKGIFAYTYQQSIFFFVLCVVVQWVYFRRKYLHAIVATLVYSELSMVLELLVDITFLKSDLVPYKKEIACSLCGILVVTVVVVILHGLVPKTTIQGPYLFVICVFTMVSLLWNWALIGAEGGVVHLPEEFHNLALPVMVFIFFLFQIVIVFFVLKIAETHLQKQTTALIELNNKMLQKSLDETEQTFESWRQSVHDYKNHVIVLKQMLEEQRLDEMKAFLVEEHESINKQLFMIHTGNSVVDTLVNLKYSLAEKHHITFMVHGVFSEQLAIEDMDLATILGNLLDNAIEASMQEQDAYIDMTIKMEKQFLFLNIRNKCRQQLQIELGKTSKENEQFHGIGLKSVSRVVKKYDGEINIENKDYEYIVMIIIPN